MPPPFDPPIHLPHPQLHFPSLSPCPFVHEGGSHSSIYVPLAHFALQRCKLTYRDVRWDRDQCTLGLSDVHFILRLCLVRDDDPHTTLPLPPESFFPPSLPFTASHSHHSANPRHRPPQDSTNSIGVRPSTKRPESSYPRRENPERGPHFVRKILPGSMTSCL